MKILIYIILTIAFLSACQKENIDICKHKFMIINTMHNKQGLSNLTIIFNDKNEVKYFINPQGDSILIGYGTEKLLTNNLAFGDSISIDIPVNQFKFKTLNKYNTWELGLGWIDVPSDKYFMRWAIGELDVSITVK
jgi:hypothetical protein